MEPILKFIGMIHSSLKNTEDCPLQENEGAPEAEIVIYPEYQEGIKDVRAGSEVILLTWLHKADRTVIKCFPRRDYAAPHIGVFSTRSPDRPNPIGIHIVKVISVSDNNILRISALELIDQTPLIDIKPVIK
jgi:tRNA-Thr(GGU) m(6)t(6)A37 methyltransferase TsaA